MLKQGIIPNLVVAQRVLDKMAAVAHNFIQDETGEAMIGLVSPAPNDNGVPTIYVLDTISPDESAVRELHTFQQGDERQDEIIWWLQENWHIHRQNQRTTSGFVWQEKWDVPLRYLGDWHKQPGFMIAPSGGDLMTALAWLDDPENQMEFLLAPIVTVGHDATTHEESATVNYKVILLDDGSAMRVDFWYIHREVRLFQPITPVVYPNGQIPGLAQYPWHLVHEERATLEFTRFEQNQIVYSVLLSDTDGKLPLEVCITAARPTGKNIFLIATPWNYPDAAPVIRVTPFVSMDEDETIADVFDEWWQQATPAPNPNNWQWSPDTHLIDYIEAIEEKMGISHRTSSKIAKED